MTNTDDERARTLSDTFGLSAETAEAAAKDNAKGGMRKPASDDVELERIASAQGDGSRSADDDSR